ncbi:aspartyl protease family protein [Sphingosinicella sp. BN140058]|uniref:aspartyl protease family protein n=1 Tax=Sphingosinicella sp. BN140058 TaxID=1892855 RepID=UPI0013E9DFAF|nr:aspartyl protease family protein [Sphingosinicella sp. BN140058]
MRSWLPLLLLAAPAAAAPAEPIRFRFAAHAPVLLAEGRIGAERRRVSVVIDTGATAHFPLFLSADLAARLRLRPSSEVFPFDSTAIGPERQSYRTARLDSFELGSVQLEDAEVAIAPLVDRLGQALRRPVDVIVGQDFLDGRVVAIDYRRRRLDLDASRPDAQPIPFRFAPARKLLLVEARVNGAGPFTFEIDTGSSGTLLSPRAAAAAQVVRRGEGVQHGAGGSVRVGIGSADVSFGGLTRSLHGIAISDTIEGVGAAAGSRIDGIIGFDFLAGTRLTIDYPGKRLWLAEPR